VGTIREPYPVILFLAVLHDENASVDAALNAFRERFGPVAYAYGPIPFEHTSYYASEMGTHLFKTYLTFERPIPRQQLAEIKVFTNQIEQRCVKDAKRTINLDPGYLSRDKLVLASTKDFYHRIYLAAGIFAEVTLHYRQGTFRYFSWTYPDYKDPNLHHMLQKVRGGLVGELRKGERTDGDAS
jgi:hypothetical protein